MTRKQSLTLKQKVFIIVFGNNTKLGRRFDIWLLWFILGSVLAVMLESIPSVGPKYASIFFAIEIFFTVVFLWNIC